MSEALLDPVTVVRASRRGRRRRLRRTLGALAGAVVVMFFVDVLLGSYTVTVPDFLAILGGAELPGASFIVWENKLPRAVLGLLVGLAFGVSGAVFQTLLRNPLASPDIVGVTAGASTAAVVALVLLGVSGSGVSWVALAGAVGVAVAVHLLAGRGPLRRQRLVLMGIGTAALMQALTSYLLTRSDIRTAAEALVWLSGSLNNSSWARVGQLLLALVVLLPVASVLARSLPETELGDDVAAGLGVDLRRSQPLLLLAAVGLAAVATAATGPIAFVAFVSGPIARRLLPGETSLTAAALVGALVVLGAEFVASNVVAGVALPVGVVTGALGAPFLLYLLISAQRVGRGG